MVVGSDFVLANAVTFESEAIAINSIQFRCDSLDQHGRSGFNQQYWE